MPEQGAIAACLDLQDTQHAQILVMLAAIDPEILWQRPAPRKRSIRGSFDHTRTLRFAPPAAR